jgi:integrase
MSNRYRLFRRDGVYYLHDAKTGKQKSLRTREKKEAERVLHAYGEAQVQPSINRIIGQAYLHAADPGYITRKWRDVTNLIISLKKGETKHRWETAAKDAALAPIMDGVVTESRSQMFLEAIQEGKVSTNVFLRRIHNYALDMSWLLNPVIPRRAWPKVVYGEKRAIARLEHEAIIAAERNPERRAFYELCWYLGASQGDVAHLHAEDIDGDDRVINYDRRKMRSRQNHTPPQVRFSAGVAAILATLPNEGPLFPYLITVRSGDRATEFRQRCDGLGFKGISLHSYRYAWAERAKSAGYPERYAQVALGHNSKAVARAYSKKARVEIPALEDFEIEHAKQLAEAKKKMIPMPTTEEPAKDSRENDEGRQAA